MSGHRVAVSAEGLHFAIAREHELSVYTVEPLVEIARRAMPPCPDRTLAFVGRQLLVHDGRRLTVLTKRLAVTAELDLERPTRLMATSHHYALLAREDETLIATCTSESTTIAPTRTPLVVQRAVGVEGARFLTWSKIGAELWDAATRLPTARVGFELPTDACDAGATGMHRSVWVATATGDLITSRLSDGKTTVAQLPGSPHEIASHPFSAWLVMDFDRVPHAVNNVLRSWQRLEIPSDCARAIAPGVGAHAYVIVSGDAEVMRCDIGVDAIATNVLRIPVGGPLPDDEVLPAPAAQLGDNRFAKPPTPNAAAGSTKVPTMANRFERRLEPRRTTAPIATPTPTPDAHTDWRDALWRWSNEARADATAPLPAIASPLHQLADRAGLDLAARRILHVLYADWLAGHGDIGVAASTLAEIAGATAWEEALGNGGLGRHGLVSSHVGRCLLVPAVGAFIDGRDPEAVVRIDGTPRREVAAGLYCVHLLDGESPAGCAGRLAGELGPLALAGAEVERARVEAWLRSWPLVVDVSGAEALTDLVARPGELLIVIGSVAAIPALPD